QYSCVRLVVPALVCLFLSRATLVTGRATLSLHDALPIWAGCGCSRAGPCIEARQQPAICQGRARRRHGRLPSPLVRPYHTHSLTDRKSTRLNSSHVKISYAVSCLK